MLAAALPYLFPLAGALALASIARDIRAHLPTVRAMTRGTMEN
jgi:hypothetical protein